MTIRATRRPARLLLACGLLGGLLAPAPAPAQEDPAPEDPAPADPAPGQPGDGEGLVFNFERASVRAFLGYLSRRGGFTFIEEAAITGE